MPKNIKLASRLLAFGLLLVTSISHGQSSDPLTVEYIAHASFKLTYQGHSLLIDPFADTTWIGYKFPKNISADAALISHPHYDHDGGRFRGVTPYWEDQLQIIEEAGKVNVHDFSITGVKGKHCDPYGKEFDQKNTIWLIEVAGMKIAHLGDNGALTEENYDQIGEVDILFAPIDGDYHILKPAEIEAVVNRLNPKLVVPMHYRLPDLENEGQPKGGLGNIDPYLEGKSNVRILETHIENISLENLPMTLQVLVFQHSPEVKR
jgi:L-ascorbate metabolism protein UlaG (beta-lactamase superfamily)